MQACTIKPIIVRNYRHQLYLLTNLPKQQKAIVKIFSNGLKLNQLTLCINLLSAGIKREQFQADLVEIIPWAKENNFMRYILTIIESVPGFD